MALTSDATLLRLQRMSFPDDADILARSEALERQSCSLLGRALQATSGDAVSVNAAYQAGYIALMSALSVSEVGSYSDHPNKTAAALGAQRLRLSPEDQLLARDGASTYYSPATRSTSELKQHVGWARRARAAADWAP
ncbi:hypothetical protein CDN99_04170 [Roseateles aquatilis]|uniref:Uncharacterized protein n=2 Tax=Roseateles aquatilis TaxID=431061 RepID=A0A246JM11_9BURK|nr:hypothetical protein CDN99_04170 [Roseateles aquatilis]